MAATGCAVTLSTSGLHMMFLQNYTYISVSFHLHLAFVLKHILSSMTMVALEAFHV